MHPLAKRRILAHLTDCVGYLGVCAVTVPAGVAIATTTDLGRRPVFGHLVSMVPPAIATVLAARAESGPGRATRGKCRQGLQVSGLDGSALTVGRALGRNTAKIFVPWQLGHTSAIGAAWGGFQHRDALTYASTVTVYALIGVYAWMGLRGWGRGVHDLIADSDVVAARSAAGRRPLRGADG